MPPAIAVVCLLSVQIWVATGDDMHVSQSFLAIAAFVGSALYLAATGELRMELKQVGKREERLAKIQHRQALAAALEKGQLVDAILNLRRKESAKGTTAVKA